MSRKIINLSIELMNKRRQTYLISSNITEIADSLAVHCINTAIALYCIIWRWCTGRYWVGVTETYRVQNTYSPYTCRALDKNVAIANKSRINRAHHTLRTVFYRSQYVAPDVPNFIQTTFVIANDDLMRHTHTLVSTWKRENTANYPQRALVRLTDWL